MKNIKYNYKKGSNLKNVKFISKNKLNDSYDNMTSNETVKKVVESLSSK